MAIVFGLQKPDFFLAKSDIWIPKCTERGGGSTGLGNIPKKIYQCFSKQDLWFNIQVYCGVPSCSWGKSKRLRLRGCLPEKCTSSVFVNKTTNVQLCSSQRESYLGGVGGELGGWSNSWRQRNPIVARRTTNERTSKWQYSILDGWDEQWFCHLVLRVTLLCTGQLSVDISISWRSPPIHTTYCKSCCISQIRALLAIFCTFNYFQASQKVLVEGGAHPGTPDIHGEKLIMCQNYFEIRSRWRSWSNLCDHIGAFPVHYAAQICGSEPQSNTPITILRC